MEWNFDEEKSEFEEDGWCLSSKLGSIKCQITESQGPVSFNLKGAGICTIMNYTENSFLVVKEKGGISLTFKGQEKYHTFPDKAEFTDGVYASGYFYFYDRKSGIYQKGIDKKHPVHCLDIDGCDTDGRSLRITGKGKIIMVNNEGKRIAVLKIQDKYELTKKNLLEIPNEIGGSVVDHQPYGDWKSESVATLTKDGYITAYEFSFDNRIVNKQAQIKLDIMEDEEALSLAISGDSKLFAVHSRVTSSGLGSKIFILEFVDEKFFKKVAEYDLRPEGFGQFLAFDFHKMYKDIGNVVFCAASYDNESSKIIHFTFDTKKKVLSELVNLRRNLTTKRLTRFSRIGKNKAIIGSDGKMVSLKYG